MIKFTNPDNLVWRSYAARIILVLITTAIIIAVLPRTQGKMYHYDEGKPWLYEQLIAKFDFPIFKSEETLKNERDSLMKSFVPYFNLNENIGKAKIAQFRKDYKDGIPGLPPEYVDIVAQRLHELYETGIVNSANFTSLMKASSNVVHVVVG